jgi:hypothetical protein
MAKATIKQLQEYFGTNAKGEKVTNREVIDFKKADPEGYDQLANGIGDGTLTY